MIVVNLITAIIKPHMLDAVKDELKTIGVQGMTVTEVRGFGRQGGHSETYRGAEYTVDLIPKLRIEVLAAEPSTAMIVDAISSAANTGKIGDGKVWVVPVASLLRIRTSEVDVEAV